MYNINFFNKVSVSLIPLIAASTLACRPNWFHDAERRTTNEFEAPRQAPNDAPAATALMPRDITPAEPRPVFGGGEATAPEHTTAAPIVAEAAPWTLQPQPAVPPPALPVISVAATPVPAPIVDELPTADVPVTLAPVEGATTIEKGPMPIDYGNLYWLGDGYDALSGQRRVSCLDSEQIQYRAYPVHQSYDTLDIVYSVEELASKLNVEFNAEVSGTYENVTATPAAKTNILKETEISSAAIVAVAEFRYVKDHVAVYGARPSLAPARAASLATDPLEFRGQCGDKFTRSLKRGAALVLVFKAVQIKQLYHDASQVQEAIKIGMNQLFGVSTSLTVTVDQRLILNSFRISARCYSEGASAHPCADNQLNIAGVTLGDAAVLERIAAAKKALAADVEAGSALAVLDEEFERYAVPAAQRLKLPDDVYFNYAEHLKMIQGWLKVEDQLNSICAAVPGVADACDEARVSLGEDIANCADQNLWPRAACRAPTALDFANVRRLGDAGLVDLFADGGARGQSVHLDFSHLFGRQSVLRPYVLYSLHTERDAGLADRLSSVRQQLKNGWRLVFYEHPDGSGRSITLSEGTASYVDAAWFNDKASSFRLLREL